jgi:hypothetical protein
MKAIATIGILLVAALPGWAQAPSAKPTKDKVPTYYPLKVGSKWHYQVDAGEGRKVLIVNQIAKIENIDGQNLARLETVANGEVKATEHLSSNDQGVFRNRYNGMEVTPPVCLLKYPIKEGQSWETETKAGEQQLTVSGREGRAEIQVPAGKYQTVTCLIETSVNGMKISTNYWFAPDVGVVKQTIDLGGRVVNMELVKFEDGK